MAAGRAYDAASAESVWPIGERRTLTIDGVDLACWQLKQSPRYVVFLHGNSMSKEVFYRQYTDLAETGWSLLAIDLPGHGASSNAVDPTVQYTITGYALIVERLLAALEIENPVLCGWSLGGNIAIEMVGRGFAARGLFLVGTPPVGPGTKDFAAAFRPAALESPAMRENAGCAELTAFANDALGVLDRIPRTFLEAVFRTDDAARSVMGAHWASGVDGHDQQSVIAGWAEPIGYVIGSEDPLGSVEFVKQLRWRHLWRGEIHVVSGCGHAPFFEAPAEFNTLFRAYLRELP